MMNSGHVIEDWLAWNGRGFGGAPVGRSSVEEVEIGGKPFGETQAEYSSLDQGDEDVWKSGCNRGRRYGHAKWSYALDEETQQQRPDWRLFQSAGRSASFTFMYFPCTAAAFLGDARRTNSL